MLKLNFCMRKRPDRSLNEFSNYWREQHGPYALSGRTARLGMRRYVQNHLVATPLAEPLARLVAPALAPYEGICQLWFDGEDAVLETRSSADGAAATQDLVDDERRFLDLPNCAIRFYREEFCIDRVAGSGAHKVVLAMSLEHAGNAGLLGRQVAKALLREPAAGISRAVQNFGLDTPANGKLREPRSNDRAGFDYLLEIWFADYASMAASVEARGAVLPRLASILRSYCQNGQMCGWIAEERVMIGGEDFRAVAA
ncbi:MULTISPECIES: EthD domain-containing protein [unclassified Chelatococcus]|uniref:EthD domain-containing protein n=1 Tax=unclassified Chelatococcus TaxID=2638111 RepID=UPI001BCAF4B0|nr:MULTISPECIES: EthD domain-containing protein [unclassified Chelatococcus]CAH1655666.1 EthD domain-containing protein [Hyphomicrobiales bacterium]MBS7742576.1 EthD domain-containing protein [Chelatococcus sp. HY11]MBX3542306.1 EthD domain-containing protein [Chelatococcus sp.]MCO5075476.1 EthD domain-containing protein [Chelatococcus sp.]CAH1695594.1 EthD domain-containing protein [Hyphomicrobiales bacterium]